MERFADDPFETLPILVTSGDVAAILGFTSSEAFLAKRVEMEDLLDFPSPVQWVQRPYKWRRDMLRGWWRRQAEDMGIDVSLPRSARPDLRAIDGGLR
ncbi:MAG: hypothetical protein AAFY65_01230 [Pseudomonadota bacterium]